VLRIHDILVRIRIRGSMSLTNGSGFKVFCLLLFEATIYIIFQDKKSKRSHKTVGRNQGFSYYFCLMIEGSGSIPLTNGSRSGSRRPKNIRIRRIRIRNTGKPQYPVFSLVFVECTFLPLLKGLFHEMNIFRGPLKFNLDP
jgi:hypothetical protein